MAELQVRHRAMGRGLSTATVEVLAVAHHAQAAIALANGDVGPKLRAAAEADGVELHIL